MIAAEMERLTDLTEMVLLNRRQKGLRAEEFEQKLSHRIVGQEQAKKRLGLKKSNI